MKKIKRGALLSRMLFASVLAFSLTSGAHAATSASQTLSGTLALVQSITTNGGTITSVIDPTTGNLNTTLNPGFTIKTNTHASQALTLKATLTDQGGSGVNALYGNGTIQHYSGKYGCRFNPYRCGNCRYKSRELGSRE